MITALALVALAQSDLQYRWVYLQTNLFRPEAVTQAVSLIERMSKAGYNGLVLTDTKIQAQDPFPDFYRKNVQTVLDAAKLRSIDVIPVLLPTGYAGSMLSQDPTLIESMPCRDVAFVAKAGELVPEQDARFQNGDFETVKGNGFSGFAFQDGIGSASFADYAVKHSGAMSLRIENPGALKETSGNCRVMQRIAVKPWQQYRLSGWIKTQDFEAAGSVREMVLDPQGKGLSFTEIGLAPTQDWKRHDVVFNSQGNTEILAYLGVWGGRGGKLWFDDVKLENVGFLNVTRRPGCPLILEGGIQEGRDVQKIEDPKFGNIPWPGEFDFSHEPPHPKLVAASQIKEGQRVTASYYVAVATDQGKTAICPSEPKTWQVMQREVNRATELFKPKNVFFAHDENRIWNWCAACQARKLTPGELLAADIKRASAMAPGVTQFVWSDMFDPYHNAVKDYYLANGTLAGSWTGLDKKMVIVNWNSDKQADSLKFFADRGHRQVLAGYYDSTVDGIKPWMAAARQTKSLAGVMYTTWSDNYSQLEAFAKAAWGK